MEIQEGSVVRYFVKEMTGAQRDDYFNKTAARTRLDEKVDVVGMKDYKGLYSTLLSFCLYDQDQKPIPESQIQEWPDTAQKALFDVARGLNGLNNKEGDEKN